MNIEPFSHLVIQRDVQMPFDREPSETCMGCKAPLGEPHDEPEMCFKHMTRWHGRLNMIALSHAYWNHPDILPSEGERWYDSWREMLAVTPLVDDKALEPFRAAAQEAVLGVMVDYMKHRHLDASWDGKGLRPSKLAALAESMREAGIVK